MQYQKPALVQRQELRMTPQLLQSIQLMTLPLQELKLRIQEELEVNPALEITEEPSSLSLEEPEVREEYDYFENSSDPGFTRSTYERDEDTKRQFLEGALSRPESLHEHLLWQLRLQPILEEQFEVGELLIRNLDDNGFYIEDPYSLVPSDRHPLIEASIEMIRGFEPVGTCVAHFRESLLVQARRMPELPAGTEVIIQNHLDALDRGKYRDIAKTVGVEESDVEDALELIKQLTPFPGRMFSTEKPRYVIPDLSVERKEGQFVIVMNDEEIPVLGINALFSEVAAGGERKARRFANSSVRNARWFINSIHQRNQTLLKVAQVVVEFQRDFFMRGKKHLVPLTLKDVANEIDVSEATVSRIANRKYIQTEYGLFELRHFFTNSISGSGSTGSRFSKEGVKEIIREILEQESREGKSLSDQKISDLLAQRGIKLARRTVNKYRSELDISSSYER